MPLLPDRCPGGWAVAHVRVRAEGLHHGVDTHRDRHVAAVATRLGAILGTEPFPAAAGCRELLDRARRLGTVTRAGVEGTGSCGAALTRCLPDQGIQVVEVNRPDGTARRTQGKADTLDAQAAVRGGPRQGRRTGHDR